MKSCTVTVLLAFGDLFFIINPFFIYIFLQGILLRSSVTFCQVLCNRYFTHKGCLLKRPALGLRATRYPASQDLIDINSILIQVFRLKMLLVPRSFSYTQHIFSWSCLPCSIFPNYFICTGCIAFSTSFATFFLPVPK